MTTGELIQRIQSLYSKGVQSDDSRLRPRHIYNKLLTVTAKLYEQQKNKKQKINQWSYQVLPCVELIETPIHECPCIPVLGCTIFRTKYKIPAPISGYSKHFIQSVTSLDGQMQFAETTWKGYKYKKGAKYTSKKPDYFIRDNYLYISSPTKLKVITIEGLFGNVEKIISFPNYCDEQTDDCGDALPPITTCKSLYDEPFPIEESMIDNLIQLTLQELVGMFNQLGREDQTNNAKDNFRTNEK
jgi:hypothetical protein